jgi:transcriptional regulator with XRE-family HTH domain/Tfp pilus assembly protein PilF
MGAAGDTIRTYRQRAGLSQAELAGEEFSASYVSLIEAGKRKPGAETLARFAERLGCRVEDLQGAPGEPSVTVELELSYARLTLANGEPAAALQRLTVLLGQALTTAQEHAALALLAEVHEKNNDLASAIRVLKPLYELCLAGRSPLAVSSVAGSLCRYCLDSGDLHAAVRVAETGLAASTEAGLTGTDDHLRLHATLVMAYLELGDSTLALATAEDLLQRAEAAGSSFGEAAAYWNAAMVAEARGQLHEALRMSQRALALLSEQGPSRNLARLQYTVAWLMLCARPERVAEAASILDRSRGELRDFGTPAELARWECNRSIAHLLLGQTAKAEETARRAMLHLGDAGDDLEAVLSTITLGDALVASGRRDQGLAGYRRAASVLSACGAGWKVASFFRAIAYRLTLAGEPEESGRLLEAALDAVGIRVQTAAADIAFGGRSPFTDPLAELVAGECARHSAQPGTGPGSGPLTIGTLTALPHSVHEPS